MTRSMEGPDGLAGCSIVRVSGFHLLSGTASEGLSHDIKPLPNILCV